MDKLILLDIIAKRLKQGAKMKRKHVAKAVVKTRGKKHKTPYRVLLGHVSKDGKKYNFESRDYTAAEEAMAAAQGAIDKENDALRQIQIVINPEA